MPGNNSAILKRITNKFIEYFVPKKNTIFERYKFNSRRQQADENVDFVTALYLLAETCKYGALKEELIHNRIVTGVRDMRISKHFGKLAANLIMEKVLSMA